MKNKRTLAICDRCGLEYKLHQLKKQVVARKTTSTLVCRSCLDKDQPQWFGPRNNRPDPAPIPNARPEINEDMIYGGFGWGPVGGMGVWMRAGIQYDFDLRDTLVERSSPELLDLLLQEDGDFMVQEDAELIDTE